MSKEKLTTKIQIPKANKGITLVALIITIVVMLILVAVTLSMTLGENGVVNTSKEAKEKTDISKEREQLLDAVFATVRNSEGVNLDNIVLPEGFKEISMDENKAVYQGPSGQLYEVENITGKITEIDGILNEEIEDFEITTDTQGVTFTKSDGVTPGDPNNLKNGDIVIYGDYKYTYSSGGWSVAVLDKTKEEYGKIAEEIYGKPITSLVNTFNGCTNLKVAPEIPSGVTNVIYAFYNCNSLEKVGEMPKGIRSLDRTFYKCTSLIEAPEIPEGVTNLEYTFKDCESLVEAPNIPTTVTKMAETFSGCRSLKEAPIIPYGVTNIGTAFGNCTSLKNAPEIPNSVTNMAYTFAGCTSLEEAPKIPENVTNMENTFSNCSLLVEMPEIPSKVTKMERTFQNCYKLQGEITINASPTTYANCFQNAGRDSTGIILKGSSTVLNELASTNTNGKVTVGN